MNDTLNDSPDDITSVDLTIRAASGNLSPAICANGRNQLPVEIIARAMRENPDGSEQVLHFTYDTWLRIISLCHAESDNKLTRQGSTGWCFTASANDYSREIISQDDSTESRYREPGDVLIPLYVYTDNISIKRIAVSIDTDNGKHFTTADNASGAEKNSVAVNAIQPFTYDKNSLIYEVVTELGKTQVLMHYYDDAGGGGGWSEKIDAHYDNLYFTISHKIQKYTVHNYGGDGKSDKKYPQRISQYWTEHDNQHMLVANPSTLPKGESTLGFYGDAAWSYQLHGCSASYDLFLKFIYNDRQGSICWTHFSFAATEKWVLPDGLGLTIRDTDLHEFTLNPWFEFYDLYGNYGAFNIRYNDVSHQIEVYQR